MKELWKDIAGYEGLYKASNMGRIKSFKRKTTKGGVLKLTMGEYYLMVNLCKNGTPVAYNVHRIIAETWIPNPLNLPQVNHKKGIQTDNRASELEWCDASYNQKHRFEVLNQCPYNRELLRHEAIEIYLSEKYHGYRIDLAKKFNVSVDVIESIRMGRNYRNFTKQLEQ